MNNEWLDREAYDRANEKLFFIWGLDYDEWKRRERWRWSEYLRNWDPLVTGNTGRDNMGYLSASVFDKWFFGNRKFLDPPPYDSEANQFIKLATESGLDPAGPMEDSIRKMVDYYYPHDLDDEEDVIRSQKEVPAKIQWIFRSNFEEVVNEEESKPKYNTLGRYLWHVPHYKHHFNDLKTEARNKEEKFLLNSSAEERTKFYEETDRLAQRWALELNDYAPLLAHKWEKKHALAQYLMNADKKEILETLKETGGVKQLFINAGVIAPDALPDNEIYNIH